MDSWTYYFHTVKNDGFSRENYLTGSERNKGFFFLAGTENSTFLLF